MPVTQLRLLVVHDEKCWAPEERRVAVLIADAGRGAVDESLSWPVPPQQLMFLPATPPSRSPLAAVPPGAERWPSSGSPLGLYFVFCGFRLDLEPP